MLATPAVLLMKRSVAEKGAFAVIQGGFYLVFIAAAAAKLAQDCIKKLSWTL